MFQINASIALHNSEIWCAYRTQHLHNYDAKSFISKLDANFEPISDIELIAQNGNTAFEDIRLFSIGQSLLVFYNYHAQEEGSGWRWQYAAGFGVLDRDTGFINNQISLRNLARRYHEKNWTPYIFNNELFMVTDFDPFVRVIKIGDFNLKSRITEIHFAFDKTKGWEYGEIRGGTPLIKSVIGNIELLYGFVHSFLDNHNGFERYYFFTAVQFNPKTFETIFHPNPLRYEDEVPDETYLLLWKLSNRMAFKVIFPIGILNHSDGKGVVVSFGKDDVSSFTEYYAWDYIFSLFDCNYQK